jgi:hypothetical protein
MMHFEEFSENGAIKQSQMAQLDLILDEMVSSGCSIRYLKTLAGPVAPTAPTASKAPTTAPSAAPTAPTAPTVPTVTTNAPIAPLPSCKIAFRMDNIQEDWLVDVQIAVMNLFAQRKVPLSLGVLDSHFGLAVDPDSKLTPWINLKLGVDKAQFEIVPNGYDLVSFTSYNATYQQYLLNSFKTNYYGPSSKLNQNTLPVVSFIPPLNSFDGNTLQAMRNTNYTTISAWRTINQATDGGITFYNNCSGSTGRINGISHYPEEVKIYNTNTHEALNSTEILNGIRAQLNSCGNYSVIVINFEYFATNTSNGVLVQAKLDEFEKVLVELANLGCSARLLRDMDLPANETKAPTPAPTKLTRSPTGSPTAKPGDLSNSNAPTNVPTHASSLVPAMATILLLAIIYLL